MFILKIFCDTQQINKSLVKESYSDYITCAKTFYSKYPKFNGFFGDYYENLNDKLKYSIEIEYNNAKKLKQIFINNLLNYCKNYPKEKISSNKLIKEYKEYPYRLEQNIEEVLLELDI